MLRIAVCDDEKNFCGELESYIVEYAKINREKFDLDVYYSGEELLEDLKRGAGYDLIFLDVEMREVDGIQAGSSIRRELDLFMTQIVYVTSHEQYAMDLFQNQPFDFVAKPVERERIFSVMKEYQRWYGHANLFYEFVSRRTVHKVSVKDILYVNSQARKLCIHTTYELYETYEKLSTFMASPPGETFIQISKSFAVNAGHISGYHYDYLRLDTGRTLEISRNFRKGVRERLVERQL